MTGHWQLLVIWMGSLFERIIIVKAQPNKKIATYILSILTIEVQAKIHIGLYYIILQHSTLSCYGSRKAQSISVWVV